jgi:hypothetical protein
MVPVDPAAGLPSPRSTDRPAAGISIGDRVIAKINDGGVIVAMRGTVTAIVDAWWSERKYPDQIEEAAYDVRLDDGTRAGCVFAEAIIEAR